MRPQAAVPDESYRPGVREDFDRLYRMSYHRILYTLTSILRDRAAAEDCTQEAFTHAFQAWPRWKPSAPAEAWIHRIAINVSTSYRRQQRLQQIGAVIGRIGTPGPGCDPAASTETMVLRAALQRLPAKQAAAIVLRHHHGYSNREIAYALNVSESTIASRLAAAKQQLAMILRIDDRDVAARSAPSVVSARTVSHRELQ
jgi:RNA polymerase sigma-70 factor, ECF subfamily